MVALIANGYSTDPRGRPFRRRNRMPILITGIVLTMVVAIVWIVTGTRTSSTDTAIVCNRPADGLTAADGTPAAPLGRAADRTVLTESTPAPLWDTTVRVYNANGQGGQAAQVAAQFAELGLGMAEGEHVANDPVYIRQNLQCQGQIRFGDNGTAQANTVSLLLPCAELIRDDREDATVDVALGTLFNDLSPNADAEAVLKALRVDPNVPAPQIDRALLDGARGVRC